MIGDKSSCLARKILSVAVLMLLIFTSIISYRFITGQHLGIRSKILSIPRSVISLIKGINDANFVKTSGNTPYTNIIFLHQSTGYNLIEQGDVRQLFAKEGYALWDHSYNSQGLRDPTGNYRGYSYRIPGDNTNPDGLARIFKQHAYKLPMNAFSGLLQHDVIIFKSCFSVNNIASDTQLEQYKTWYLEIRDTMDKHPDKIFIIMTPPPLNPVETDKETAARARLFANWLKSDEYLDFHPNIFTFDFFDLLAEGTDSVYANQIRNDYRDGKDSHPNRIANQMIAPIFVDFVIASIEEYNKVSNFNQPIK
jgi:hypothetical protein